MTYFFGMISGDLMSAIKKEIRRESMVEITQNFAFIFIAKAKLFLQNIPSGIRE